MILLRLSAELDADIFGLSVALVSAGIVEQQLAAKVEGRVEDNLGLCRTAV